MIFMYIYNFLVVFKLLITDDEGAYDGAVSRVTALQTGRSRVRLPMLSLEFSST
jgi:hypothetical protein